VALLVLTYAFAIIDRVAIGLLVEPIKADLKISDTEMGLLQGLAFALFYSLFGFPLGFLVDRWRRVRVLALSLTTWSLATVGCGLASSFSALFVSRTLVGAGEAGVTPASSSLIADLFPPSQRAKAFGVFMLGGSIGTAAAYVAGALAIDAADDLKAALPLLGGLRDWQIVFLMIGAPGLALAALMSLTLDEPQRRDLAGPVPRRSLRPVWDFLKTNSRAVGTVMASGVLNNMVVNAQILWLPTLFIRVHEWEASATGTTLGLLGFPCGVVSALSAGWLMTKLYERGRIDAPIFPIIVQSAAWLSFGTLTALAPSPGLALVAYAASSLASIWATTAVLTGLSQITPNELRGQVIAVYMVTTGLVSLTLGGVSVGLLTDNLFVGPQGVSPALACVYAVGGGASLLILAWGRRAFARSATAAKAWSIE